MVVLFEIVREGHCLLGERLSFSGKNNLPKGTTEFVCVDGKAYLLKDAPAGSIDDRSNLP